MRSNVVLLASLVALFVVPTKAATAERRDRNAREFTGGTGWGSTREEIQEHRNQRKRQLKSMIHAMRKKLADHSAGEITLDPKEKADTERRVDLYSRKLDMLKQDLEEKVSAVAVLDFPFGF